MKVPKPNLAFCGPECGGGGGTSCFQNLIRCLKDR